jgi:Zn-dependent protease with chaperone function
VKLAFASAFTLGLLAAFLLAVVVGAMYALGTVSFLGAIALILLINLTVWLVGPWFNDLLYSWLYDIEWVTLEELRDRSPASAEAIENVTAEYGYSTPKLGVIQDRNPNAFTYGSGRWNGRIVVTEGIFEFLDDDEAAAVVAHELGHITHYDFVVMTVANTLVQLLYLVSIRARRAAAGGGKRSSALVGVAVAAYVFFVVGEYLLLYLSRVREYYADAFAHDWTDGDDLAMALVKIAYGITVADDDKELTQATRNIGVMDVATARGEGVLYASARGDDDSGDGDGAGEPVADGGRGLATLERSFLWDMKNPWAWLVELRSTHPLTGKRVRALADRVRADGGDPRFDVDRIVAENPVDTGRMWRAFARDVGFLALPVGAMVLYPVLYGVAALMGDVPASLGLLLGGWLVAIGFAMIAKTAYKYPPGGADEASVLEVMADPYASPVHGRRVRLDGELIGKGQAGYRFSADMMFQDDTGLLYLNYESWLPLLGNLLFAVTEVRDLVGSDVAVEGWFFRGVGSRLGMRHLWPAGRDGAIDGYVHVAGYIAGAILLVAGVALVTLL